MRQRTTSAELNPARRETLSNPFRRKRRANGEARYLNRREERMHPSAFDRAGNPTT